FLAADPDLTTQALLATLRPAGETPLAHATAGNGLSTLPPGPISLGQMGHALRQSVGKRDVSLLHLPLSWHGAIWPFTHPLDFLGSDGGGGIGAGPGISVGAALALRGTGRLPISICGDGDFLMGVSAIWTAVHYHIPLLIVVANNQSFF